MSREGLALSGGLVENGPGGAKGKRMAKPSKSKTKPEPKPSKAKPKADDVRDGRGNAPVDKGRFVRTDDRKDKPQ